MTKMARTQFKQNVTFVTGTASWSSGQPIPVQVSISFGTTLSLPVGTRVTYPRGGTTATVSAFGVTPQQLNVSFTLP